MVSIRRVVVEISDPTDLIDIVDLMISTRCHFIEVHYLEHEAVNTMPIEYQGNSMKERRKIALKRLIDVAHNLGWSGGSANPIRPYSNQTKKRRN